jgi:hypothetical protein
MRFICGAKGLNAKGIHKEIFTVYNGKCRVKRFTHILAANVSLMTKNLKRKLEDYGFRRTDKAMGHIDVGGVYVEK